MGDILPLKFHKNGKSSPKYLATFFQSIHYAVILATNWLGYIFWAIFSQTHIFTPHPVQASATCKIGNIDVLDSV
jgi:hypothetical protein